MLINIVDDQKFFFFNCHQVIFAIPVDHTVKIKDNDMIDKDLDLASELKNVWTITATVISIVVVFLWNSPQVTGKRTREARDQRKNQDHPDHSTVEISKNTETSTGDQMRFAVRRVSVKNYKLKPV